MNKFLFKSTNADFQKLFQSIETKLEILNKNILYVTHVCDKIGINLNKLIVDKDLQNTVDKYFDETSHQTEPETLAEDET